MNSMEKVEAARELLLVLVARWRSAVLMNCNCLCQFGGNMEFCMHCKYRLFSCRDIHVYI